MKINNETKVGILVVVALVLLILGFNFLKGKNLLKEQTKLYAIFSDLGSIEKSNAVKINGLPVGTVYDYEEIDKNLSGIVLTINMTRDVNIPDNSIATIESEILGSGYIEIRMGTSKNYLTNGDTLVTEMASSLLGDVKAQVNPTLGKMRETLDSLKLVLGSVNRLFDPETQGNVQDIIFNLRNSTYSLKRLLDADHSALAATLENTHAITANLRRNNDTITATLSSARQAADKLARLELQPTIDTLDMAISNLKSAMNKLNSKEGSLGAMLNDRQAYDKLNDILLSAEILLDDIRLQPRRYVNLSIFGRKDRGGPINSPLKKDTTARLGKK